ncbi:MAG: hypothetical protein ACK5AJ_07850 [bacterium]
MKYLSLLAAILIIAITAGCAGYSPSKSVIGVDRVALVVDMGQPDREYTVDGVKVLHFPRGPAGSHTYFVYLDENDRVLRWEQVLTEDRFNSIQPGMTKDQVVQSLGVTNITIGLARNRGSVWHYRYENPQCKSFVIEFTPEDTIRSTEYRIRSGRRCKYVGIG